MLTRPLTVHTLDKSVWSCRHCVHGAQRPRITRQHLLHGIWHHRCIIVFGITSVSQQRLLDPSMLSLGSRESKRNDDHPAIPNDFSPRLQKQQPRLSVSLLN